MTSYKYLTPELKANRIIFWIILAMIAAAVVNHNRAYAQFLNPLAGPYYYRVQTKHLVMTVIGPFRQEKDCVRARGEDLYGASAPHDPQRRPEGNSPRVLYASDCWPG